MLRKCGRFQGFSAQLGDAVGCSQSSQRARAATRRGRGAELVRAAAPLSLQIPVDEVVLLEAAQPLTHLAGADETDALDRLELALRGSNDRFEAVELLDDPLHHRIR